MQTKIDQNLEALTDGVDADRDASVKADRDQRQSMVEALQDTDICVAEQCISACNKVAPSRDENRHCLEKSGTIWKNSGTV